jgi:phosphodiesterase/alkaline phosphatase D-like protein
MILDLTALDFMDTNPVPGARIEAVLWVGARGTRDVPLFPGDPGAPTGPTPPGPGSVVVMRRRPSIGRLDIKQALPAITGQTDAQGKLTLEWDPSRGLPLEQLFARMQQWGTVFLEFHLTAQCAGLTETVELRKTSVQKEDYFSERLLFDFAKTIVGHVTPTQALLWFALNGQTESGATYICEVFRPLQRPGSFDAAEPLNFIADWGNTATAAVADLAPGTPYRYRLVMEPPDRANPRVILATGSFRTPVIDELQLRIVFSSCHHPFAPAGVDALERCRAFAQALGDVNILLGDQIYGDRVTHRNQFWFNDYSRWYQLCWTPQPFREMLRRAPTYMQLDDHEVADDWGITFTVDTDPGDPEGRSARTAGALRAYRAFQQAHNPGGRDGTLHYHFRRGPAAFFFLDDRTQRGRVGTGSPVLGSAQIRDLAAWAGSDEVADADVIVLVAPVPLAFLPINLLSRLILRIHSLTPVRAAASGFAIGGLVGAYIGWKIGSAIADAISTENGRVIEPDLADQWAETTNQPDLVRILDILFGLANDNARNRLVFVLAGDSHVGGIHRIISTRPEHQRRPAIIQFMASPLSHEPADHLKEALEEFRGLLPPDFALDSAGDYRAELFSELVDERNFGTLTISRRDQQQRLYQVIATIEGQSGVLDYINEWNLDEN